MSLLKNAMTDCQMMDKVSVSDGRGGLVPAYVPGAEFAAAVTLDTSTAARIGEAQGVRNLYTVTTTRAVNLQFHDVFVRLEDNKVFRITSDGDDKKTPATAGLDMRVVSAEEWSIPSDALGGGAGG